MKQGWNEETHNQNRKHGQRSGANYNGTRPRAYAAWVNMRQRCTNPKLKDYKHYGLRGITFSRRWEEFANFLADMGEPAEGMTLDRIDNMGDYTPENCRWVPYSVQALNKRNCVRYELNGKSQTLAEWSRETGIGRITMLKRIQRGMPLELALTVKGYLEADKYDGTQLIEVIEPVKKTPEERRAITAAAMNRPDVRAKISAGRKGIKPSPRTPEHCAALSASQIGKVVSEETRAKLAAALIGKKRGPYKKQA